MNTYTSVDDYIKKADKDKQPLLQEVRMLVQQTVPKSIEGIAYGMPAYTYQGKPLFYFAVMKGHLGLYPTPGPIQMHKESLQDFSTSKGCVRIPYTAVLPKKLITLLLKARIQEIKHG